jgi:serine phosphatase RsbU (regulator of sigma subunit)/anti-sigma regulatory factor (Ser/Thr protein kinase)
VTAHDEQADVPRAPSGKRARYALALAATAAALLASFAILESDVSDEPMYAPLIGAVALSGWYGGLGPLVLAIALGWGTSLWLLATPRDGGIIDNAEDLTRWWVNLAFAVVIGVFTYLLRWRQERVADELVSTRTTMEEIESLQQLSIALGAAFSTEDVTRVLTSHAGGIVGADGVTLGRVEGDRVAIVDATGIARTAVVEGLDVPLAGRNLLAAATRDGRVASGATREELEAAYPDSAGLLPDDVRSAFAVPLTFSGRQVVGALGFVFADEGGTSAEALGLAQIIADLAAQALERAQLYERERESRQALDRILQITPLFLVDGEDGVLESICREARMTFGADFGVLWRVDGEELHLLAVSPPPSGVATGLRLPLADFPRLSEAIRTFHTSFVSDVRESSYGAGHEFVHRLGIRSSLRTPVVIAGRSELVLAISWQVVVSEPDTATRVVLRRFADQAGLVLEQLERRRAQAEALRQADATRRLQQVTAALSNAATPFDVSTTCLEQALEAVGAEAGFVVLTGSEGRRTVELVTSTGYEDDELEAWRALGLDADAPFARAIASGEPVWALEAEHMSAFTALAEPRSAGWITIPLPTSRGIRGVLHLSLRTPRVLDESERGWLVGMVAQCGQALERSGLYDDEQRSRRRAERLQSMTARLSNALTPADVAEVVVEEISDAFGAATVALAVVVDGRVTEVLASSGDDGRLAGLVSIEQGTPGGAATRSLRAVVLEDRAALASAYPDVARTAGEAHETYLALPLVAARRVRGLIVALWDRPSALVAEDRAVVEALAGQAAQALDRAGRYESEQAIAETLQRSVLPDLLPRVEGVELAARYLPGSTELDVGGDWFDAFSLPEDQLGLVVGDVVGKGVQAAASMAQLRNALRAFSVEHLKPSTAVARLNRLCMDVLDAAFATVAYVSLDPATGVCRIASAGHPPPVVAYPDGRVELLEAARGLPLGTSRTARYRQETVELPAGSVLLLYTDGLVERRGRSIDDGLDDTRAAVAQAPTDPDRLLDHVLDTVIGDRDREDDVAILAARMLPVAPRSLALTIPSNIASMPLVRDALRTWVGGTVLDRSDAEALVLAAWEACANAIEHAVAPADRHVRVRAETVDSVVRVVIEDTGGWAPPSGDANRGFGLRLMEALVSDVAIERNGEGTRITLEQRVAAASGDGR